MWWLCSLDWRRQTLILCGVLLGGPFPATVDLGAQENGFFDSDRDLVTVNSTSNDSGPWLTQDGLELWFHSRRDGARDIWVARRGSVEDDFGEAERVPEPVNSDQDERRPSLTADGLELFFSSDRPGSGGEDLWVAVRSDPDDLFEDVRPLAELNTSFADGTPAIIADGLILFFLSDRSPGTRGLEDIFVAERPDRDSPFGEARNLGAAINTPDYEFFPFLSAEGTTLLFTRGSNYPDIWMAVRQGDGHDFATPVRLPPPVSSFEWDGAGFLTNDWPRDGAKMLFASFRPGGAGGNDLWEATWNVVIDDLRGTPADCAVHLRWSNPNSFPYDALEVRRDGELIAGLDPRTLEHTDADPPAGAHGYVVQAKYASRTYLVRAQVDVPCERPTFRRGEVNGDAATDLSDAVYTLSWLFLGGTAPGCLAAADVNASGSIDIADPTYLLNHLFLGGAPPAAPFPGCEASDLGSDEALGCETASCR